MRAGLSLCGAPQVKGERTAIGGLRCSGDAVLPHASPSTSDKDVRTSTDWPCCEPTPASRSLLAAEGCSCLCERGQGLEPQTCQARPESARRPCSTASRVFLSETWSYVVRSSLQYVLRTSRLPISFPYDIASSNPMLGTRTCKCR
jgi:hypothetical protein